MWQEMSYLSGLDKTWGNGGKLENRGFDVEATGVVLATPSWQWQVGASVGHYKNEVTALPDGQQYMDTEILGATVRTEIGRPANLFYGYRTRVSFPRAMKPRRQACTYVNPTESTRLLSEPVMCILPTSMATISSRKPTAR